MSQRGFVHIYCGDGKGKTSAAFGLAIRCAGHGGQVVIAQFLKDGESGECNSVRQLPNIQMISANPTGKFSFQMTDGERVQTAQAMTKCLQSAVDTAEKCAAHMLVLDEIMAAISCGFIPCETMLSFLRTRPQGLEVVMTGRNPPPELIEAADYVSEICKRKHPFDRGVSAREGIEW